MIGCRNLLLRIKGKVLLGDVSFDLGSDRFLAIIGPNGAGKSSLLKCLMGLHRYEGQVTMMGRNLRHMRRADIAKRVAYVPQLSGYMPAYTVSELVAMSRYVHQPRFATPTTHDRELVKQALEQLRCQHLSDRLLPTLSGGERQKVFLAAALAQEPELLLLDEPLTWLDPRHQAEIRAFLRELHTNSGPAVLMVTHDLGLALDFPDQVLALKDGGVAWYGTPGALGEGDRLSTIFDVEFDMPVHPRSGRPVPLARST